MIWWGVVVVGSNPTFRSTIGSSSVVEHYKLLYNESCFGRVTELDDCDSLENCRSLKTSVGSNPTPSVMSKLILINTPGEPIYA